MVDWSFLLELTKMLVEVGRKYKEKPPLNEVEPFKHYFFTTGNLKYESLDEFDGTFTRREIIARYLLLNVVLDQGPDIKGVRELLKNVTSNLYRQGIRIFHEPSEFFRNINTVIAEILKEHERIKKKRAREWAEENKTIPTRYNLFFAQSNRGLISIKQVLDYTIHRWGVPLSLFLLLEKDYVTSNRGQPTNPFVDYLESHDSAETMARKLKDDERYGLGSAIGDKACHLFTKLYVSTFKLVKKVRDNGWTDLSYETPFDSNAGRVLFRTGFLLECASEENYKEWGVIQEGRGKGGKHYLRITNIRDNKVTRIADEAELLSDYANILKTYLKIPPSSPRHIKIQHLPNLLTYRLNRLNSLEDERYSLADFDDGLIHIGTNYCLNTTTPYCKSCHLNHICKGYKERPELIEDYLT
jgi:hypothetical protein